MQKCGALSVSDLWHCRPRDGRQRLLSAASADSGPDFITAESEDATFRHCLAFAVHALGSIASVGLIAVAPVRRPKNFALAVNLGSIGTRHCSRVDQRGRSPDPARLKVKIIITGGVQATIAAKRAALPIPVVFTMADPVGAGVVASLAHPGGNMTGQSLAIEEQFAGKWLELLKEAAPQVSRVAYLWNPLNHSSATSWKAMQGLAPTVRLTLQSVEIRDPKDIDTAFAAIIGDRAEGVIVDSDRATGEGNIPRIVEFAAGKRLPAIYVWRLAVDAGGLMSYGPSFYELWRHAATYVDKILKGTKPADLPVEQPTRYELVVNLKTAKALGLSIPPAILARADEVIE